LWHLLICDNTFFLISLFKMRHVIFSLNEYVICYVMFGYFFRTSSSTFAPTSATADAINGARRWSDIANTLFSGCEQHIPRVAGPHGAETAYDQSEVRRNCYRERSTFQLNERHSTCRAPRIDFIKYLNVWSQMINILVWLCRIAAAASGGALFLQPVKHRWPCPEHIMANPNRNPNPNRNTNPNPNHIQLYIHIHIHGHLGLTGCRNCERLLTPPDLDLG